MLLNLIIYDFQVSAVFFLSSCFFLSCFRHFPYEDREEKEDREGIGEEIGHSCLGEAPVEEEDEHPAEDIQENQHQRLGRHSDLEWKHLSQDRLGTTE